MRLIQLSRDVAVNPDKIDAIQAGKGANNKSTIVIVNGKNYPTQIPPQQLLQMIEFAAENKWDGFFAG